MAGVNDSRLETKNHVFSIFLVLKFVPRFSLIVIWLEHEKESGSNYAKESLLSIGIEGVEGLI